MTLFAAVIDELKRRGIGETLLFGGGIIPPEDIAELKQLGVHEIFTPGASTDDIIAWVRTNVQPR
jgi:methylmalonyl-CoA mutase C-terminal domain/subunit